MRSPAEGEGRRRVCFREGGGTASSGGQRPHLLGGNSRAPTMFRLSKKAPRTRGRRNHH
jgi:hypothetical protein